MEQEKAITKTYLIKDLFLHFQGHQLTDKYIYNNEGIYPVYSGSSNKIKGYINEALFYKEGVSYIDTKILNSEIIY